MLNSDLSSDDLPINIGVGYDISIKELAEKIKKITGYTGETVWDRSKPDGAPKKLLDNSKMIKFGWKAKTGFDFGLEAVYKWYIENKA